MKNKFAVCLLFAVFSATIFAQAPEGYYNSAAGKSTSQLKTALYQIIKNPDVTSYAGLWYSFMSTDERPDNPNHVWDMYSDVPNGNPPYIYEFQTDQCGSYSSEGDCYNREHSFPKSWFGGEVSPMYRDLFHLYPSDGKVNGMRSNYPYGEVQSATWTSRNGSKLGSGKSSQGYTGTVFEPIDAYKGDFARTYFYMATCYENLFAGWIRNSEAVPMLAGNAYPGYKTWAVNLLLKWHRNDPVSQKEIDRNNVAYTIQNNRNPFIDYPELVEYIWGNQMDSEWQDTPTGIENLKIELVLSPNPAQDELHISSDNPFQKYEIFNLGGQKILAGNLTSEKVIPVSSLQNGLYILCLIAENQPSVMKKFAIRHNIR
ncbi:MAG: endonuclease [Dysgonamonadaceae bacterium]|jgi:endonuclease I|nr:endonuclease [Dysgonamonadaceae bacterium]